MSGSTGSCSFNRVPNLRDVFMNRQEANNALSFWGALLVVPILVLAVYLHFNQAPVQHQPEVAPHNSVAVAKAETSQLPAADQTDDLKSPITPSPAMKTPVALDPEAARTAVHQVENGVYERATLMFEREPVDAEWASSYEQALREMFAQHQGLQRVSINSISCHSSMCRIEVFTPRDTDADFFTAMFYDALATFRAGALKAEAAITRRMEQGMTSVYVARQGHTLGFY